MCQRHVTQSENNYSDVITEFPWYGNYLWHHQKIESKPILWNTRLRMKTFCVIELTWYLINICFWVGCFELAKFNKIILYRVNPNLYICAGFAVWLINEEFMTDIRCELSDSRLLWRLFGLRRNRMGYGRWNCFPFQVSVTNCESIVTRDYFLGHSHSS